MTGAQAEHLAAWLLRLKGYRILARRWRSPAGEIDLIARRGRTLAFVEVKLRPDSATAHYAIRPAQQQRILRAASHFVARHARYAEDDMRVDAILVVGWRWPKHIMDAWRAGT